MRVAIVGAGVSGISALWVGQAGSNYSAIRSQLKGPDQLLNEYSEHEVNIYEKNDYPGGHTNTQEFKRESVSCI